MTLPSFSQPHIVGSEGVTYGNGLKLKNTPFISNWFRGSTRVSQGTCHVFGSIPRLLCTTTCQRVFLKGILATSNATYAPTSQRCHKCNEVGHYANRCPKLTNAAPVPTRHSSALVTNQSSNQNGFTVVYQEPEAESKDPTVEDFYELFSKQPSNHLSQSLSEQTGIDYNCVFSTHYF
ncbi:hypothetical protein BASA50_009194 [Batrachochytrium salamandrivorans]|uniref:CCHC-type domain-containing protein n=1 Tax=Batrachochytrium salamandrivorans TaxID=1357716 RepID=A0ABQ8F214_9FUNG|nr:hypothetical protein BASA50_009194 [Batrachochytrium salamandrivorans]KAH9263855.1 hypothetical protein BASA83_012700 [Batrachochytrium salamandrivorans]